MIEARPGGDRAPLALAAALGFAVGVGALIVQSLWLRALQLALGGTSAALAATLLALVLGQAGGARLGEWLALRAQNPLRAFALLAAFGALAALGTPLALRAATAALDAGYDALLPHPALLVAARFAAALAATAPAAIALGALAPTLFAATLGGSRALGGDGVGLYALQALGSALGAALATFVLVERAGVAGALASGAGLLATAGACAAFGARRWGRVAPGARGDDGAAVPVALPRWLVGVAALSGFGTFAAQGLFAQALGRVSNESVFAAGAVLVCALAAVGLGALFVYSLSQRAHPLRALGVALAVSGAGFLVFPSLFVAATGGLGVLATDAAWPAYLVDLLALAAATTGPVLLPAACVFPCALAAAGRIVGRDGRVLGAAAARLLAWNAAGAALGALAAPFALLPALGLWGAFAALGVAYLLGALRPLASGAAPRFAVYAALLGALVFAVVRPDAQPALRVPPGARVVDAAESGEGLVAVLDGPGGLALEVDNHSLLGGARDRVHQERQGSLPLLLHPHPRSALYLGSATGSTASAALAAGVDGIVLVEIAPGVARAARRWFRAENRGVYDDPRARVVVDDARSFVRASGARFDVIVGDLFVPWQARNGGLYALEHFARVRARLASGGIFCQWLPLYQLTADELATIARSFVGAFGAADLWRGDFYGTNPIVALCGAAESLPTDALANVRALPGATDRWLADAAGVRALYVARLDAAALGAGAVERESAPVLEFATARSHAGALAAPITGIAWAELAARLAQRPEARAGALLQAASAYHAAGREPEAAALFSEAARRLPPELVRDAPPDPSAAELWHTLRD